MKQYRNVSGRSGVTAYEDFDEAIAVLFQDGGLYLYDYETPGENEVEEMKERAEAGKGLATYISQVVGGRYARKLR